MSSARTFLSVLLLVGGTATPSGAGAEERPETGPAAEVLFQEGRSLLIAGKVDEACPKLEESQRLDPATGTLLAVAICHERQGRLAKAWASFAEIEGRSRRDGRADREQMARQRAEALRPRLSTLTLRLPSGAAEMSGFKVSVDGVPLGRGAWNVAIPIDGGDHVVETAAPGRKGWRTVVAVKPERDQVNVEARLPIKLDAAPPAPPSPAAAAIAPEEARAEATATDTETETNAGHTRRVVSLAIAGTGAIATAAGVFVALDAKREYDKATAHCPARECPPEFYGPASDARTRGNIATVVVSVGAAALATGAILWLTAPTEASGADVAASARARRPRSVGLAVHPRGAGIVGEF